MNLTRSILVLVIFTLFLNSSPFSFAKSALKDINYQMKFFDRENERNGYVGIEVFAGKDRDVNRQYFHNSAGRICRGIGMKPSHAPGGLSSTVHRRQKINLFMAENKGNPGHIHDFLAWSIQPVDCSQEGYPGTIAS